MLLELDDDFAKRAYQELQRAHLEVHENHCPEWSGKECALSMLASLILEKLTRP